jgi:hypothetical protein
MIGEGEEPAAISPRLPSWPAAKRPGLALRFAEELDQRFIECGK